MTNIQRLLTKIIAAILIAVGTWFLISAVIVDIQKTNAEYEKFTKLSDYEKVIYNCTKDISYYSGASNGWAEETQNYCINSY